MLPSDPKTAQHDAAHQVHHGRRSDSPRRRCSTDDTVILLGSGHRCLTELLHARDRSSGVEAKAGRASGSFSLASVRVLAPLDDQEVWGAGVTYERSKVAREQESDQAATFYDRVYTAARPELFFKATPEPGRRAGAADPRSPRHPLVCSRARAGPGLEPGARDRRFTIGNDVSAATSRARTRSTCRRPRSTTPAARLGPVITLATAMPAARADRNPDGNRARRRSSFFEARPSIARMARRFEELDRLARPGQPLSRTALSCLTGTGIVPPDDFSLTPGDVVRITIDGIGTLVNSGHSGRVAVHEVEVRLGRQRPRRAETRNAAASSFEREDVRSIADERSE